MIPRLPGGRMGQPLSARILARLMEAELHEVNSHLRDDYRIARLTVTYAAEGACRLCSPQVAATYMVLGLHPDKVWPAIVARQKASLGAKYGRWFDQDGVRLGEAFAPKKPPESVRFAREEQKLKKASGAGLAIPRRFERVESPIMATTVPDYRDSDSSASGKWPRDLMPWFESCDLPDHLRVTMLVLLKPKRSGLNLSTSKVRLAIELGVTRRTAQRRVRRLRDLRVLEEIGEANKYFKGRPDDFRPSFTYRAHPEAVAPRPTWKDFEQMRPTHRRVKVKSATQHRRRRSAIALTSSPLPQPAADAPTPAPSPSAAPVAVPPSNGHRDTRRQPRRLTPREGPKLVAKMAELMRGHTRHQQLDGYAFNLEPDDPRYRAPMSQDKALIAACMTLGITEEDAREHLKLCCWKFDAAEPSS